MARVAVKDVQVQAQIPGAGGPPFNALVTLNNRDAQLLVDPISEMKEVVEITGIGVARRQRRDAALADVGAITVSGILDAADPDGLFKLLTTAHDAGDPIELVVRYGAAGAPTVTARWLVASVEYETSVGTFVMVRGSLEAEGTFGKANF